MTNTPLIRTYPPARAAASAAAAELDRLTAPFIAALETTILDAQGWHDTGAARAHDHLTAARNHLALALLEAGRTLAARDRDITGRVA